MKVDVPTIGITPEILRLISEVDEFKGKWKATNYISTAYLTQLEQSRVAEGSAAMMRLSGVHLMTRAAKAIYAHRIGYRFTTPEEKQVLGCIEAYEYVHKQYQEMGYTESCLKQLHVMMQRYTARPMHVQGGYKRIANKLVQVKAPGYDNSAVVAFQTAKPFEAPNKIIALMQWLESSLRQDHSHPLIVVAIWLGMFLTICPFQEGNKKLALMMCYLVLLKSGYSFMSYTALESVIEQDYDMFYEMLAATQEGKQEETVEWERWVVYILRCVRKQKNELLGILDEAYFQEQSALNTLSVHILELFNRHSRLTISDIVQYTGANRNTVKLRLRELTREQYLVKSGKARATWYTVA